MLPKLEPVDLHQLKRFQALYTRDWPKYCAEFYCLDNFIRFFESDPQIKNVQAYTLAEQSAKEAALFLIVDRYQLFVGCLDASSEQLKRALGYLDWSTGFKCSSIPARHIATLESVVDQKKLKLRFNVINNMYYMPQEEASQLKVEIPDGYQLRSLTEQDADLINDEWPNHHEGSLYFVQRQIRKCANVGLYVANTNELVAWCIRLQGGYLGALQVRSTHTRRGFGSVVAKELARRIAAMGQDVMALVNLHNLASSGMFEKLGFKVIDQCSWLRTEPVEGKFFWPEGQ